MLNSQSDSQRNQQNEQLRLEQVSLKAPLGSGYLLQEISFAVQRGEWLGIVGASGAGKTTLLRVLNRLSEPSQGRIWFEQQEIRQVSPVALRQQIVLVPQESRLLGMTVRQALAYPLWLRRVERHSLERQVQIIIEQLHIPAEWLERTEVQLSVGQRQLVAIGRALIMRPKILLLDEPTSALDAGRSEQVLKVLQELIESTAMTILMVNHQLEQVQQFCQRLLSLQRGQISQIAATNRVDWATLKQSLLDAEVASEEWLVD